MLPHETEWAVAIFISLFDFFAFWDWREYVTHSVCVCVYYVNLARINCSPVVCSFIQFIICDGFETLQRVLYQPHMKPTIETAN